MCPEVFGYDQAGDEVTAHIPGNVIVTEMPSRMHLEPNTITFSSPEAERAFCNWQKLINMTRAFGIMGDECPEETGHLMLLSRKKSQEKGPKEIIWLTGAEKTVVID